jgi:hypothetical protein
MMPRDLQLQGRSAFRQSTFNGYSLVTGLGVSHSMQFDIFMYPAVTEYTVMQTMSPTSFAWGYIAATSNGYKPTV